MKILAKGKIQRQVPRGAQSPGVFVPQTCTRGRGGGGVRGSSCTLGHSQAGRPTATSTRPQEMRPSFVTGCRMGTAAATAASRAVVLTDSTVIKIEGIFLFVGACQVLTNRRSNGRGVSTCRSAEGVGQTGSPVTAVCPECERSVAGPGHQHRGPPPSVTLVHLCGGKGGRSCNRAPFDWRLLYRSLRCNFLQDPGTQDMGQEGHVLFHPNPSRVLLGECSRCSRAPVLLLCPGWLHEEPGAMHPSFWTISVPRAGPPRGGRGGRRGGLKGAEGRGGGG